MNRTFLIARREFAAYAMTVGFWVSLLAFPAFAVLGGAVPILIRSSEPVREVVVVEDGAHAAGLRASVEGALTREAERQAERTREAMEKANSATGGQASGVAAQGAMASMSRPSMRIVATPTDIASAAPGQGGIL